MSRLRCRAASAGSDARWERFDLRGRSARRSPRQAGDDEPSGTLWSPGRLARQHGPPPRGRDPGANAAGGGIYDEYAGGGVESIARSLERLEHTLPEVDPGDGILHSLIFDEPTDRDLVVEALAAGARLNRNLAMIDRGDGTLGLIVNDPTLYEDLKLLVGGANRSAVVRGMVRTLSEEPK